MGGASAFDGILEARAKFHSTMVNQLIEDLMADCDGEDFPVGRTLVRMIVALHELGETVAIAGRALKRGPRR